jgi:hypothetical protein
MSIKADVRRPRNVIQRLDLDNRSLAICVSLYESPVMSDQCQRATEIKGLQESVPYFSLGDRQTYLERLMAKVVRQNGANKS